MNKGLLVVAVLLLFQFAFIGYMSKLVGKYELALKEQTRAKNVIAHIQKLRHFGENAAVDLARYKHSNGDSAYIKMYEMEERNIPSEVQKLKYEVRDRPKDLARVNRIEKCLFDAKAVMGQYRQELQDGSSFGEVAALLRLARIGMIFQPEIDALLEPYQSSEKDIFEETEKQRNSLYNTIFLGLAINIGFSAICVIAYVYHLRNRAQIIVENTQRVDRKETLLPIVFKFDSRDEIHIIDVAVHRMNARLKELDRKKEEIEQMKQEFVSMISHDLRSPLTSLQFTLGLLADGTYGDINETGQDRVGAAEKSIVRLIGLINNLLDLEKMESGMMTLKKSEITASELFDEVLASMTGFAEEKKVKLEVVPSDTVINADIERLAQVVVNLVSNAIKFSPEGSRVKLIAEDVNSSFLKVSVIDHGRGVPKEFQQTIFERFKQVKDSDGKPKKGTGLGLAIAKAIVELHGGAIGLESKEGEGSTFWFTVEKSAVPALRSQDV